MGHGRDTKGDRERRHHVVQERLRTHLAVTSALAEAQTLAEAAPRLLEVVCRGLEWELGALWRGGAAAQGSGRAGPPPIAGPPPGGVSLAPPPPAVAPGGGGAGRGARGGA